MKPCLVVFYSRTGITRKVAETVALQCGCDIEVIREMDGRSGLFNYLRSGYEAVTKKLPDIIPTLKDPADYDITILGTPVWGSNIASPMRSYIMRKKNRFNHVAAFCTMGGSGGDKVLNDIGALCEKSLVAKMALTDQEISGRLDSDRVAAFVKPLALVA